MEPKEIGAIIRAAREQRKLSQAQLGALIGIKQASIQSVEKGETARSKYLPEIARELGISPADVGLPTVDPALAAIGIVEKPLSDGQPDFPVYASAEGGPGQIIRSTDPVDFLPRPTHLMHVRDAYGLVVTGTSMEPEYRPGDMAIVEPRLSMVPGEVYIFYSERDGEARATIKYLRRATSDNWLVSQHNPPDGEGRDFSLPRKTWTVVHRVTGKQTRR